VSRQLNSRTGNTPHRVGFEEAAADGRIRRTAVDLYSRAGCDWSHAPGVLERGFRAARALHSRERRFVSDAVYGMIRLRRRLAYLGGGESSDDIYAAFLAHQFGRADETRLATIADPIERLAVTHSLPDFIARLFVDTLGLEEANALAEAMNARAPLSARANRLLNTREELMILLQREKIEARPLPLASDGVELLTQTNAYGLAAFREGRFELQDAASQICAELVAPPPGGLVVDACAGAGGKALALGARMQNRGRIVAFDPSERKLVELKKRARRAGLTNLQAKAIDEASALEQSLAGKCDRVLLDVPCSGLGVLRRNPEARWRVGERDLVELPRTQRAILERYAPLVAVGGRIIYATCSVAPVENDAVVDEFLAAHAEFESVLSREILGAPRASEIGDGARLRLYPHRHGTDGFFAAVLRRRR
jgi:16S rRNA (cytosine967-C5)-methyltransferase